MKANIVKRTVAGLTAVISAASAMPATMFAAADEVIPDNNIVNENPDPNDNNENSNPEGDQEGNQEGNQEEQSGWSWTPVDENDPYSGYSKATFTNEDGESYPADITITPIKEATHEKDGAVAYTATIAIGEDGEEITDTQIVPVKAIGHTWKASKWIWDETVTEDDDDDYSYAGIKFTCNDCPDSTDGSGKTVKFVYATIEKVTNPATCEEDGSIVYNASLEFDGQEYKDSRTKVLPKLGHDWQEPTYKWEEDLEKPGNYKCTATQICKNGDHPITETVSVEGVVTTEPTVDEKGEKTFTATFENEVFKEQTYKIELGTVAPEYYEPVYVWNEDYTACTATMKCKNGSEANTVTETCDDIEAIIVAEPTCTTEGTHKYIAKFTDSRFATQEKTVDDIEAKGHEYNEPEWTFDEETRQVLATFRCKNCDDVQTIDATKTSTFEKLSDPTCEEDGEAVIHASIEFEGVTYTKDYKFALTTKGHEYNINWYWDGITTNEEGKLIITEKDVECTFVARCPNCGKVVADVANVDDITYAATCQKEGKVVYTATALIDDVEYTDTKEFVIAKVDHDFGEPEYAWEETDDGFICTATRKCKTCAETETETVDATYEVIQDATVSATGVGRYTATFESEKFATQTKDVTIARVLPEYGDPVYEWSDDNTTVTATRPCTNGNPEDALVAVGQVEAVVTKEPTCSAMGETTYTAVFEDGDVFPDATKTVANIPMTEHNWSYPIWNWAPTDDGYEASVIFICQECGKVESTEAVVTSAEVDGYMVYTAEAVVNGQEIGSINKVKIVEENKNPDFTVEAGDKSLTLNWDTVDGAEKYGVCAVQRDGSWKVIAQPTNTETSYTINNLSDGREYMVCVIAMFDGKWEMNFGKAITMATLENKVPEVSYTPGDGSVKLTWTEVANAEGYGVVARVSGKWELLGSGKGTSYTMKNLTPGKEYTVAVVGRFDGKWNMDFSNAITVTPNPEQQTSEYPTVNNIEYNDKYHQFRVHWNSVENAEAYGIAYYSAGKWRAYGDPISPETTTWTSPKLTAGRQYTFAVVAKIDGKWDTSKIQNRAVNVTVK